VSRTRSWIVSTLRERKNLSMVALSRLLSRRLILDIVPCAFNPYSADTP
jgi:hypothetical protein